MPTHSGPNTLGESNLVFAYDTGDTRNSYEGEPTTNLISSDGLDMSTLGSYTLLTRSRVADNISPSGYACEMEIQDGATINAASRIQFGNATSIPTSGNVFISVYAKFQGGPISNIVPRVYTGYNWYDMTPLDGGSIYLTSEYRRFGVYVQVGTNSGGPNPGFSMTHNNSNRQTAQKTRWHSPQVELKLHVTPFTSGRRSATQGLLDLTGTSAIDLSNVSFDSNAQMTFDGTDDIIQIPSATWNILQTFTLEAVFKANGTAGSGYHVLFQKEGGFSGGAVYGLRAENAGGNLFAMICYDAQAVNALTLGSNTLVTNGQYYHVVSTFDSSYTWKIYINGVLENSRTLITVPFQNTSPIFIGRGDGRTMNGDLPISKIYNRALTASEISINFNAIKNRFNI
jgi:hypothetical protein